ncbi:MAG: anhydro-N-acetylmuramic acid kinase [Pseudomonadota bacterium]
MTSAIQFPTYVIGLMSGTSADGVDAALLYTDGQAVVRAGASLFVPYDDGLRADILAAMRAPGDDTSAVAQALTQVHIDAVRALIEKSALPPGAIGLIGFHGQTIYHAPHEGVTLQIGDAARMAREIGIPVIADFRSADVRAGGQGAPLVPLYHAALAHELPKPLLVVNIGGVSNVTWIGGDEAIIAFDSGPGNALLDDWIFKHTGKRYDTNGEIAAAGIVDADQLAAFLADPFFALDAPKSLDRFHFKPAVTGTLQDGAATLTAMTASAIAMACMAVPVAPKQLLITGGGRHNPTLMGLLDACVNAAVLPVETVGWDGDMLEAQAFAYLAARSVLDLPLSLPTTTGVKLPMTGGVLYLP